MQLPRQPSLPDKPKNHNQYGDVDQGYVGEEPGKEIELVEPGYPEAERIGFGIPKIIRHKYSRKLVLVRVPDECGQAYAVDYRRNEFALNVLETQELQDRCDG